MSEKILRADILDQVRALQGADIVVGVPSFNNARTVRHVIHAVEAGLLKYFPQSRAVLVNSDGGSTDGTREAVLSARTDESHLLMLSHPVHPVHRLVTPYHGVPGKGSAFRAIFRIAELLGAQACAVVDSDLRSITPEWIELLLRPLLHAGYDYVAPYYLRHKYDGTITNSIVYPLTRALYGQRVRQPIGGDFGFSGRLASHYLQQDVWDTDVARYGIDIWMTTTAICGGFRVCQSFLGAKIHDAKDPGSDLSAMLTQVVGSVFRLMETHAAVWKPVRASRDVPVFGFRFGVGLEPIQVNLERMIQHFRRGLEDLGQVWDLALQPGTARALRQLGRLAAPDFHLPDELWVKVAYDFAAAFHLRKVHPDHLLRSLTPVYMGRVASFVKDTRESLAAEVEEKIEGLCLLYEQWKPYLIEQWQGTPAPGPEKEAVALGPLPRPSHA
ncbi:MAG: glycosyltransferase [Acidobacteria bacterium]|nr:glycosyltransferase [Acidobacteriota bacterium]